MTECRDCGVEAQQVTDELICPSCGTLFECNHDDDRCLGPQADELPCFWCYLDMKGGDGAKTKERIEGRARAR